VLFNLHASELKNRRAENVLMINRVSYSAEMSRETSPFSFSALLLAGGRSTRMGRDKAGVVIENRPLWEYPITALRATGPAEILLSGPPDGPYAASGCDIVMDDEPSRGPLSGICAGLERCRTPWLLVLAIDMVRMTPQFLSELLRLARADEQGRVPECDGKLHPLAAVYPRRCLSLAAECLRGDDWSMHRFVRCAVEEKLVRIYEAPAQQKPLFTNLNTPEDLRRFSVEQ
jgi:molybdopterin-guanine dinucleotide biosynthesis protein A